MINYGNGKIYKIEPICEHDEGDVYFGSTTKERLSQRMTAHRGDYIKWLKGKKGMITTFKLFEKYGLNNCKIILVQLFPCNSKDELLACEGYHIKNNNCVNKLLPGRTKDEMLIYKKEYSKDRYENNKDKILEYQNEYVKLNKVKIVVKQKEYAKLNKDKIAVKQKEYGDLNKELKFIYDRERYLKKKLASQELNK